MSERGKARIEAVAFIVMLACVLASSSIYARLTFAGTVVYLAVWAKVRIDRIDAKVRIDRIEAVAFIVMLACVLANSSI